MPCDGETPPELLAGSVESRQSESWANYGRILNEGSYYAVDILENNGDWLMRATLHQNKESIVLSVKTPKGVKHVIIQITRNGFISVGKFKFDCVQDLVRHFAERHNLNSHLDKYEYVTFSQKFSTPFWHPIEPPWWNLSLDDLIIDERKILGEGRFGKICEGEIKERDGTNKVAVKYCDLNEALVNKMRVLHECRIMRHVLSHAHVVSLHGLQCVSAPLMLVLSLATHRDLHNFVRDGPGQSDDVWTTKLKLQFSWQASSALSYLEERRVIHNDVAARNCLVDQISYGAPFVLQLGDFGLSQMGPSYQVEPNDYVATKWAAPELLGELPRVARYSDIWSLGVLLWEIFSDLKEPDYDEEMPILTFLQSDRRLSHPESAPPLVNQVIDSCWIMAQHERPRAAEIESLLKKEYEDYGDV